MYIVGSPYFHAHSSTVAEGRVRCATDRIFTITSKKSEVFHGHGIYKVVKTLRDSKGHPIRIVRPVAEVEPMFRVVVQKLQEATDNGDDDLLDRVENAFLRVVAEDGLCDTRCSPVEYACHLQLMGYPVVDMFIDSTADLDLGDDRIQQRRQTKAG